MVRIFVLSLFFAGYSMLSGQVKFPEDEGRHPDAKMEMWDIFGHLTDASGTRIGIMSSFFTGKYLFFRGNAVLVGFSDEKQKVLLNDYKFFLPLFSSVEHTEGKLYERFGDNLLTKKEDGTYSFTLKIGDYAAELQLTPSKKPLLSGQHSETQYFFPRLEVRGSITTGDARTKTVKGFVSLDHVWTASLEEDHDVFVIQLENTSDLYVLFRHNERGEGPMKGSFVDISYANDRQINENSFTINILGWWNKTGEEKKYPSGWRLSIPSQNIDLTLVPTFPDQQMAMMGTSWWSGVIMVDGKVAGREVKGRAWVILHGYN